jgi:hypothetical protein
MPCRRCRGRSIPRRPVPARQTLPRARWLSDAPATTPLPDWTCRPGRLSGRTGEPNESFRSARLDRRITDGGDLQLPRPPVDATTGRLHQRGLHRLRMERRPGAGPCAACAVVANQPAALVSIAHETAEAGLAPQKARARCTPIRLSCRPRQARHRRDTWAKRNCPQWCSTSPEAAAAKTYARHLGCRVAIKPHALGRLGLTKAPGGARPAFSVRRGPAPPPQTPPAPPSG